MHATPAPKTRFHTVVMLADDNPNQLNYATITAQHWTDDEPKNRGFMAKAHARKGHRYVVYRCCTTTDRDGYLITDRTILD